ncbi:hypothetical protein NEISICOT_02883 [Neisseria sicca ATCC 29256]|uniref:Uncharacterized protein n=1 Tax=Neisseria sicca ATCC 29256 TaxID=547045 RepID=C6M8L0_NEISI|nr:hypothetical protein NEISICOT_02883 [Neisseria sicca ATCC 29256]
MPCPDLNLIHYMLRGRLGGESRKQTYDSLKRHRKRSSETLK